MFRELNSNEAELVSGGDGTAVYANGSWSYGNSCYATAQAAANAGATGFQVGTQYFGDAGNPFNSPCTAADNCAVGYVEYQQPE
jgi:hypothetical protein